MKPNLTLNLGLRWTIFAGAPNGRDKFGKDIIRGPGISDDSSLNFLKNTPIPWVVNEHANLQIGAEIFDVFNHANFAAVGSVFGSPTFGHVTSALDPRQIQCRAKIEF